MGIDSFGEGGLNLRMCCQDSEVNVQLYGTYVN